MSQEIFQKHPNLQIDSIHNIKSRQMKNAKGEVGLEYRLNDGQNITPRNQQPKKGEDEFEIDRHNYDLSAAAHPFSCVATFAFKGLAIFSYLFMGWFLSNVQQFIVVTVLGAVDFWVVKNVTGRLLVGLRWWSDFDEDGKEIWRFESYDRQILTNSVDVAFFWTSQLIATLFWLLFLVLKVISLSPFWGLLVFINLSLCATNLYGYYKCRGEHSKKLKDLKNKGIVTLAGRFF